MSIIVWLIIKRRMHYHACAKFFIKLETKTKKKKDTTYSTMHNYYPLL